MNNINPWEIYLVYCNMIKPPKHKFIIIQHVHDSYVAGFFINSDTNKNFALLPKAADCYPVIRQVDHYFLSYDSVVSCTKLQFFSPQDFMGASYRGVASGDCRRSICEAINKCELLPQKHQALIIDLCDEDPEDED
jgi:hypothetical protein